MEHWLITALEVHGFKVEPQESHNNYEYWQAYSKNCSGMTNSKISMHISFFKYDHTDAPSITIYNDAMTRKSYNGFVPDAEFLSKLLINIM